MCSRWKTAAQALVDVRRRRERPPPVRGGRPARLGRRPRVLRGGGAAGVVDVRTSQLLRSKADSEADTARPSSRANAARLTAEKCVEAAEPTSWVTRAPSSAGGASRRGQLTVAAR
jgi:hypothetical protein